MSQRGLALPLHPEPDRHVPRRPQGRARRPRHAGDGRRSPRWPRRRAAAPAAGRRSSTPRPAAGGCSLYRARSAPTNDPPARRSRHGRRRAPTTTSGLTCAEDVELRRRGRERSAASRPPRDDTALLLVGLVRAGVRIGTSRLRGLLLGAAAAPADDRRGRARRIAASTRTARCSTPPSRPTTASSRPSSSARTRKYIARWAARRGLDAERVTSLSLGLGRRRRGRLRDGRALRASSPAPSCSRLAFTFDCVDGQLARYTRTFSQASAPGWTRSSTAPRSTSVFAGLAIGAAAPATTSGCSRAPRWRCRSRATRSTSRSRPRSTRRWRPIAHPPLEQPHDGSRRARPPGAGRAPPRARRRRRRSGVRRAPPGARVDRSRRGVWAKKIVAFPIGERFATISLTAALFDARVDLHRAARVGRLRRHVLDSPAGCCARSKRGPTALPAQRRRVGITARGLPRRRPARERDRPRARAAVRLAPAALLLAAARAAARRDRDRGRRRAVGRRDRGGRLDRAARRRRRRPPAARPLALGGAAAAAGRSSTPACCGSARSPDAAARRVRAAVRDHLPPLRHRLPPAPPDGDAAGLARPARRGLGRPPRARAPARRVGAVPAGFYAAGALLAVAFAGEATRYWTRWSRGPVTTDYEDEEEDAE